jgi:putative transposase
MHLRYLWNEGQKWLARGVQAVESQVKTWTQPAPDRAIKGEVSDLFRSRKDLIAENAFLRQQVIVLNRQKQGHVQLTPHDRRLLVFLAHHIGGWKDALHIVKPDTVLRWHRQGFKLYWRRKSRGTPRRPQISEKTVALIKEMAIENRSWGAPRIRDELRKLGIRVSKRTIQRYMRQTRRGLPPQQKSQTWATFLANHASDIWACDFVQTYDLFFREFFLFFIIELGSRRVVHVNVTRSPSDTWLAQQIREATPFGEGPRFLICDNDGKYGSLFDHVVDGAGITLIHTPPYAPQANAVCERFMGSVRREFLDHILILSEGHARRLTKEYVEYFNYARPHQGIDGQLPIPSPAAFLLPPGGCFLRRIPVLNGLHHDYQWAA